MAPKTTTSNQLIAAAGDSDLIQRLRAVAARKGIESPQQFVEANMSRLVAAELDTDKVTLGFLFNHAVDAYAPTPRPGQDLTKITDAQLGTALDAITAP